MRIPTVELGTVAKFINGDRGKNYPSKNDFVEQGVNLVVTQGYTFKAAAEADRYYLLTDELRVGLPRGRDGSIQSQDCRLGYL